METATMGKKQAGPRNAINVKATEAWIEWLRRAAEHSGMSVSGFLDYAARQTAKRQGFDEPAPKR